MPSHGPDTLRVCLAFLQLCCSCLTDGAGWLVLASGIVNVFLGLALGPGYHVLRGQAPAEPDVVAKQLKAHNDARHAWARLRGLLSNTISMNIPGTAYGEMLNQMDAAMLKV